MITVPSFTLQAGCYGWNCDAELMIKLEKSPFCNLSSELIQARIIHGYAGSAKYLPIDDGLIAKGKTYQPLERSATLGQCLKNWASLIWDNLGRSGFKKHPASPGNCLNKLESEQAFGSDFQGTQRRVEQHH